MHFIAIKNLGASANNCVHAGNQSLLCTAKRKNLILVSFQSRPSQSALLNNTISLHHFCRFRQLFLSWYSGKRITSLFYMFGGSDLLTNARF